MIRFVFRWAFRFLLLALVLVIGLLLLKDNIARSFSEQQIRRMTGFDVKLGKVQLRLLEPRVTIENLVLYNPPEFGGSPFIDAPDIQLEYAPGQLPLGRMHFRFARLNVRELNIVESKGRTNYLEFFHKVSPGSNGGGNSARTPGYNFTGIDLLNLSMERVRYTDLNRPKRNQDIKLNLENHIVQNVRSEEDFANILLKLLFRAGITIYIDEKPAKPAR